MSKGIDLSKHISITASNELLSITEPLRRHFGITYFNYVKLLKNNGRVLLTDRADWIEYFYLNSLYETKAVQRMECLKQETHHLWCEFGDQPSFKVGREKFDIDHGLTIIQPGENSTELYYFGTTKENEYLNQLYASNLDIFHRFILFFKDKAHGLLKKANSNVIQVPGSVHLKPIPESMLDIFKEKKNKFLQETKVDKYIIGEGDAELYLTKREMECLYYLLREHTAKEIAKIIDISYRTVESYIENIKTKLRASTKKELVQYCNDTNLMQQLIYVIDKSS